MNHATDPPELPSPLRRYEATKSVHLAKPDYGRPPFQFSEAQRDQLARRLVFLYGEDGVAGWVAEVERICRVYWAHKTEEAIERERTFDPLERFTEEDVILITYGDLLQAEDPSPLITLSKFCGQHLGQGINTLHILPFFPSSSDRGFSVIDFDAVDPRLGTWADIEDIETRYKLMFDGVINHVSTQSRWFQEFLNGHPYYRKFFTSFRTPMELKPEERELIFRPRTSDVLSPFQTLDGLRYVWTTFSPDQVDLNYQNPEVFIRALEVLLHYVRRGADLLRLDAVTYLWRRPGTSCVHLPETHETVKLFRDLLGWVAPHVALITETNVPHADNVSYFGDGSDEAHLVYNFALPPMLLHAFYGEDSTALSLWAQGLVPPSETTAFFNFLDSHDGIGLLAIRDILPPQVIADLVARAQFNGGLVSYRTEADGRETPYEINLTWFSALNGEFSGEPLKIQVDRFLASRAIAMTLRGVAGIYLLSLLGARNDRNAVLRTGVKRDINRRTVDYGAFQEALEDPASSISQIMSRLTRMLLIRTRERAFHPRGRQEVLALGSQFFSLKRWTPEGDRFLFAITNIANRRGKAMLRLEGAEALMTDWVDLLGGQTHGARGGCLEIDLPAYGCLWLKPLRQNNLFKMQAGRHKGP